MKKLLNGKNIIKVSLVAALVLSVGAFQVSGNAKALNLSGPQDCNANAVIFCGAQSTTSLISKYDNGTTQNSAKSIHDIYARFGISASEVQAMNSSAVAGSVTKSGEVLVNGSVVAKNALTAGRENIAGSTQVSYNGTTFYTRSPSVSFEGASIPAYVVLKDGVFQFAIIESCANPVTATPTTAPKYTINKTVAAKGSTNFQDSITNVMPSSHVVYHVTVKSTGTAAVTDLVVKDALPAHVTYVPGTLTRDGTPIAGTAFFSSGVTIETLAPGATSVYSFEATIGTADVGTTCKDETLTNTATIKAPSLPSASDTATVGTHCQPVITTTPPTCNLFDISASNNNRTVTVTKFDYTANDAKFVSAVINWDMNKTNVSSAAITDANSVIGQTHQYAAEGYYQIGVTITFTQGDKTVAASGVQCQKVVHFLSNQPPVVTPPAATPTKPTALVNTGAGSTVALFGGISVAAAAAYHWSLRRRLSL